MAHRDDETVPDEQEDLAELDVVGLVVVAHGLEHEQQRVAVDLELRPLVSVDRVLDGELVQVKLEPDGLEFLLGRLVQADPNEGAVVAAGLEGVFESQVAVAAAPVLVHGAVDDHRC